MDSSTDPRYTNRHEPTLPVGEFYKPWVCEQSIKDYWWGNNEPIEDE